MIYLVASSRGGGLKKRLARLGERVVDDVVGGGRLRKLADRAVKLLPPPYSTPPTQPLHVYIVAGIPDITEKYSSHTHTHYTECIYTAEPADTIDRLKSEIAHCAKKIKDAGATPCFAALAPTNIEKYNLHLLHGGDTHTLYHTQHYDDMQDRLNYTVNEINTYIIETNSSNNMSTPMRHKAIKERRGKSPKGYHIYKWEGLYDGVHGTDETKDMWAQSIAQAIRKNRARHYTTHSDEEKTPKRVWKGERKFKRQRTH